MLLLNALTDTKVSVSLHTLLAADILGVITLLSPSAETGFTITCANGNGRTRSSVNNPENNLFCDHDRHIVVPLVHLRGNGRPLEVIPLLIEAPINPNLIVNASIGEGFGMTKGLYMVIIASVASGKSPTRSGRCGGGGNRCSGMPPKLLLFVEARGGGEAVPVVLRTEGGGAVVT